jgi:hypothetical protein
MPFKVPMIGKIKTSGKLRDWITHIEQWHQEDSAAAVSFEDYLHMLIFYTTYTVQERWADAGRTEDATELAAILMVMEDAQPSNKRIATYDAANYMSENMPWSEAQAIICEGREIILEARTEG